MTEHLGITITFPRLFSRTLVTTAAAALLSLLGCDRAVLVGVEHHVPPSDGSGGSSPSQSSHGDGGSASGGSMVLDVAVGAYHACALLADGGVRCWGADNSSGELGDGTTTSHAAPRLVAGLASATQVLASYAYGCALAGGEASCWGSDRYGQFGDGRQGTDIVSLVPASAFVGATTTQMALGQYHACALLPDASVSCTGLNLQGQLGDGTTTQRSVLAPVTGLGGVSQVVAGGNFTCALEADRTVACWGMNANDDVCTNLNGEYHTPRPVAGVAGATKLAAGQTHACALLADHTVTCWGLNAHGQLGSASATGCSDYAHGPQVIPGLTGVSDIVAGANHTCALRADGTAACWGYNKYGQLGDGTTTDRQAPASVLGLTDAVRLAAGDGMTCAITSDGSLWCWGAFPYGNPAPSSLLPAPVAF